MQTGEETETRKNRQEWKFFPEPASKRVSGVIAGSITKATIELRATERTFAKLSSKGIAPAAKEVKIK